MNAADIIGSAMKAKGAGGGKMPMNGMGGSGGASSAEQFREQVAALSPESKDEMLLDLMGTYLKRGEMKDMIAEYEGGDEAQAEDVGGLSGVETLGVKQ